MNIRYFITEVYISPSSVPLPGVAAGVAPVAYAGVAVGRTVAGLLECCSGGAVN